MSPGSVYLGPPSAYLSFSWWYSCTLQAAICERRGRALQDCMMDTVSKAIQESPTCTILYQPHMQHWGSPHLSANPSHVSCSTSPQVGATLEFAITCTSGGGCTPGRVPELLVSTLALAGRVSHQCHTATPATETLDKVGTQEQNHCRGFYVLIYDTCADMDSWSTWVPQRHRHSLMPVGTHACTVSDASSPKEARLERAISRGTSIHSESHTYKWYLRLKGQGTPLGSEDSMCCLPLCWTSQQSQGSKKEVHLPGDSSAACRSGVVDTQVRGALNIGAWMYVAAGLLPWCLRCQVGPSFARDWYCKTCQHQHCFQHSFIASSLIWFVEKPNMKKIKEQIVTHCKSRKASGLSALLWTSQSATFPLDVVSSLESGRMMHWMSSSESQSSTSISQAIHLSSWSKSLYKWQTVIML